MKFIKSENYKKLVKAQLEGIRTKEDFEMTQNLALMSDIESHLEERLMESPNMSFPDMFEDAKYAYLDDKDYINAPEYAEKVESLIRQVIDKMEKQKHKSEDADQQAAYEAEMGRDTYMQHGDGYETLEDTSPCNDPNDNLRSNGKDRNHQSYPNLEKTNYYSTL